MAFFYSVEVSLSEIAPEAH